MRNQLRGCIRINVSGKNLYRFINSLHCERICCSGQYCRNEIFYGEVYRHDLKKVRLLAEKYSVELKYHEIETLSSKLLRYRRRTGIILGVIMAAVSVMYFSNIVVTIDVQGNNEVSDSVILSALEELDIKPGTFIKDINFRYCENELRLMVDNISWAAIRHTGNRIVVEVTEIVDIPDMLHDRIPCNVVADKSAQITYTSVLDGMLMRKVGDYVMEGDLLISGVLEDSKGHITKHHAMGSITGIYEETVMFTEDFSSELYQPTGNSKDERYLKLFNLKIPLFIGKNNYKTAFGETDEKFFEISGKELPIGIVHERLTETELSVKEYTESELDELLMNRIYMYEKNFLSDKKLLAREITSESNSTSLTYKVKYTLEGEIGVQREIFIK